MRKLVRKYATDPLRELPVTSAVAGKAATALWFFPCQSIEPALLHDLEELELVRRHGQWIEMRPRLANVYMTALAEAMAPRIGARPLAEESEDHIAISGLTLERLVDALLRDKTNEQERLHKDIEVEEKMATIAFRQVVPADPVAIPAEKIVEFRRDYAEERGAYQTEIAKIVKELDYVRDMQDADKSSVTYKTSMTSGSQAS
jgi:Family of unknown function (DUF6236)